MSTNKARKQAAKEAAKAVEKRGKNKVEIPSREERAKQVREMVNEKMKGRAEIVSASEYNLPFLTKRHPTGLLTLDTELRGGFPAGGLSQIAGPASAGKNYLIWCIIRQLQHFLREKMKVLFAMTEMRVDRSQGKRAGVRVAYNGDDIKAMDHARVMQNLPPFTPEEVAALKDQIGEIDELHGLSAEHLYDAILDVVDADAYHLIVLDSFGNIMSAAESEAESVGDQAWGGSSGVNTRFCHKLTALLTMRNQYGKSRETCIIGLNQVRDDMKNPDQLRNPGGRALQHATFVNLSVMSGKFLTTQEKVWAPGGGQKDNYDRWAKEVNWQIRKGKAGIHEGASGTYLYDFRIDQADFYADTMIAGVEANVIIPNGSYLGIPNGSDGWLVYEQGREKFKQVLIDDANAKAASGDTNTLLNLIRDRVFLSKGITISYDWDD